MCMSNFAQFIANINYLISNTMLEYTSFHKCVFKNLIMRVIPLMRFKLDVISLIEVIMKRK